MSKAFSYERLASSVYSAFTGFYLHLSVHTGFCSFIPGSWCDWPMNCALYEASSIVDALEGSN